MHYTSKSFKFILENKTNNDSSETIREATQRLLKSGAVIIIKRSRQIFCVTSKELKDTDSILNIQSL